MLKRFALTLVLVFLLAGCVTAREPAGVQYPAPEQAQQQVYSPNMTPAPTVTLADPVERAREQSNLAYWLNETATAVFMNDLATASVATQLFVEQQRAAAEATAFQQNVYATSTAIAISEANAWSAVTQTAVAIGRAEIMATQESAARAAQEIQSTQAAETLAAERERQGRMRSLENILIAGAVIFMAVLAVFLLRFVTDWLSVRSAKSRIFLKDGLVLDAQNRLYRLPPDLTPRLPAGQVGYDDDQPAHQKITGFVRESLPRINLSSIERAKQERALRRAWREAARRFVFASEVIVDGKPLGFSYRAMKDALGISERDWTNMTQWLADMGFLMKAGTTVNSPWVLAPDEQGNPRRARDVFRDSRWQFSFEIPSPTPPDLIDLQSARGNDTTRQTPTDADRHDTTQDTWPTEGEVFGGYERHAASAYQIPYASIPRLEE